MSDDMDDYDWAKLPEDRLRVVQIVKARVIETVEQLEEVAGIPNLWAVEGILLASQIIIARINDEDVKEVIENAE